MHSKTGLFFVAVVTVISSVFLSAATGFAQPPSLPSGLEEKESGSPGGPALPPGLGESSAEQQAPSQPGLPPGLNGSKKTVREEAATPEKAAEGWTLPEEVKGYAELRGGVRLKDDPVQDQVSLAEARLQISYDKYLPELLPRGNFRFTADLIHDATDSDHNDVALEEGEGFFDLRELWLSLTPLEFLDIKAGRQILTWGTGNLLFLNDLFPKDYQSFFLGRDVDYLKAPSDALKASLYSDRVNVDIVYTPRFDPNRFVDGSRLSFYDPALGDLRGEDRLMETDRPDDWFDDDEIALRIYRNLGTYELALYGYDGYWKGPAGTDSVSGKRIFPELTVVGTSIRGTVGPGIGNLEFALYDSRDDQDGDDPFVQNSEWRFLAGYEQEVVTDLTVGVQYYIESMLDYGAYRRNLPAGFPARDENRHWVTLDLTRELLAQNQLILSLLTFYDLSVDDIYLRPKATYDFTDNWQVQMGANIFLGNQDTFFGQFQENTNVYTALRYSF